MSHSPSVPMALERGDFENWDIPPRRCMSCGGELPKSEQEGSPYYHCEDCGHVSTEYTTL